MQTRTKSRASVLGAAGLICTVLALVNITGPAFFLGIILTIIGLVLGLIALKRIKSNGAIRGKGVATVAVILAIIELVTIMSRISLNLSQSGVRKEVTKKYAVLAQMAGIKAALEMYKIDNGNYPNQLSMLALSSVGKEVYLKNIPKDTWARDYIYRIDSSGNFELFSLGQDGVEGSKDDIRLNDL